MTVKCILMTLTARQMANTDKTVDFTVSDCQNQQSTSAVVLLRYLNIRINNYKKFNVHNNIDFVFNYFHFHFNIDIDIDIDIDFDFDFNLHINYRYLDYTSFTNLSDIDKSYSASHSSTNNHHARRFYFYLRFVICFCRKKTADQRHVTNISA
ncbi:hypothetical protein EIK77_009524 [Talaromyces pinophilus]|nr:hypothetical protein EIK77_009524 [Talaromyces pinophilus]